LLAEACRRTLCGLLRNSRKTERGAIGSWTGLGVRAAPFALLRNSPKTECGAIGSWIGLGVRAAPFALLRNSPAQRSLARPDGPEFPGGSGGRAGPVRAFEEHTRTTEPDSAEDSRVPDGIGAESALCGAASDLSNRRVVSQRRTREDSLRRPVGTAGFSPPWEGQRRRWFRSQHRRSGAPLAALRRRARANAQAQMAYASLGLSYIHMVGCTRPGNGRLQGRARPNSFWIS